MTALKTKLDSKKESFKKNSEIMQSLVKEFKEKLAEINLGGSETARARHREHGKLLPRERIKKLLDKESDFLELSALAGYELYEDHLPAAGMITGVGKIHGIECMIIA